MRIPFDYMLCCIGWIIASPITPLSKRSTAGLKKGMIKQNNEECIKSFLNGIRAEITSLWDNYYQNVGKSMEKLQPNKGFPNYYPIFNNYFMVYDTNLNKDISTFLYKPILLQKAW